MGVDVTRTGKRGGEGEQLAERDYLEDLDID
jgi:hypothetical protein